MGIISMWREARGNVMRKEYEDVMARIRNANQPARSAFLNNINQTINDIAKFYEPASKSERRTILKQARKSSSIMWDGGAAKLPSLHFA
jgi:hypothetical protein